MTHFIEADGTEVKTHSAHSTTLIHLYYDGKCGGCNYADKKKAKAQARWMLKNRTYFSESKFSFVEGPKRIFTGVNPVDPVCELKPLF